MKKRERVYSRYTVEALQYLAALIRTTRLERKMTTAELAERADISRGLLYRIENGDPSCSIGVVFEVASILGILLFQSDYDQLVQQNRLARDKLALMSDRIRSSSVKVDDDF